MGKAASMLGFAKSEGNFVYHLTTLLLKNSNKTNMFSILHQIVLVHCKGPYFKADNLKPITFN